MYYVLSVLIIVAIGFDETAIAVREDAGSISVSVTLVQQIAITVTVDVTYRSDTAVERSGQYLAHSITVTT